MNGETKVAQAELATAEGELNRRSAKAAEVESALAKVDSEVSRLEALESVTGGELLQLENERRRRRQMAEQLDGVKALVEQQESDVAIAKNKLTRAMHADAVRRFEAAERALFQRAQQLDEELKSKLTDLRQLAIAAGERQSTFRFTPQRMELEPALALVGEALSTLRAYQRSGTGLPERLRATGS